MKCYNRHQLYLGKLHNNHTCGSTELFTNTFMLAKICIIVMLSLVITIVINYSYLITSNQ